MCLAFLYSAEENKYSFGTISAPIHINIEIEKAYLGAVMVITDPFERVHGLAPTTNFEDTAGNIVVHQEISRGKLLEAIYIRVPADRAKAALAAIDNVCIFIGNRAFYFSPLDIRLWDGREEGGYAVYRIPDNVFYKKSFIKKWVNWYGDFNFAVKAGCALFIYPLQFKMVYFFGLCLFMLCYYKGKNNAVNLKNNILSRRKLMEGICLLCITLLGLLLRINGHVQYSAWFDELYSAAVGSNPHLPFINTFGDPGNPPFYYILLRIWFVIFGWSESAGRMFSVLMSAGAVMALYFFVKKIIGIRAGMLAALFMAVSKYAVEFSHEMRCYALMMLLVSLASLCFLTYLHKRKMLGLILYIFLGIFIVNTHYYGVLFIVVNFLFYVVYTVCRKSFHWKNTIVFLIGNVIIAASLFPYFIVTGLNQALLDKGFNTWITRPKILSMIAVFAGIPLSFLLYIPARKYLKQKQLIRRRQVFLLDYSLFVIGLMFILAFLISLYRPIFTKKYMSLCFPLLMAALSVFFTLNFSLKLQKYVLAICAVLFIFELYEKAPFAPGYDVYKESRAYIAYDEAAHSGVKAAELSPPVDDAGSSFRSNNAAFYRYQDIPLFGREDDVDVLYINLLNMDDDAIYDLMADYGISEENVLKIMVDESRAVWKKLF
jgi:hypothetical protein